MTTEERLRELNIDLPERPGVVGNYLPCISVGKLMFVSGHGPWQRGAWTCRGKVDTVVSVQQAYEAARTCAIGVLAALRRTLGSLDSVERVARVTGYANCIDTFSKQPEVINGASDLFEEVFGENGRHARTALGVSSLYRDISVEIDAVVKKV
jgi:enamine deaminase RidA (YjgF/YER057c/UK114 family)